MTVENKVSKMKRNLTKLAILAFFSAGSVALAQSAVKAPFAGLAGTWTGQGTILLANGSKENIRCRASYSVPPSGISLDQGLRCANDSYTFDVTSNVFADDSGGLKGTWSEKSNQIQGSVTGRVSPGKIESRVSATGFNARLSVTTQGSRQSVLVEPQDTSIRRLSVDLRRS